jgi:uncharacterized LabA/DUF88 family protein
VDRCALFVDAGYLLADGAMAACGTRGRESVSWDYAGLLQFLSTLAAERSGPALLRCYWYEVAVEGRRTPDHEALADLPGLKLRLGRMRPGRREGVDTEINRDLSTLARNHAISDAVIVSAEEDLVPVIADVQDLGVRVTLAHIAVDGNWTISRLLRQECDAIIEISGAQLGPYVSLAASAGAQYDDQYPAVRQCPPVINGHVQPVERPPAIYAASAPAYRHEPAAPAQPPPSPKPQPALPARRELTATPSYAAPASAQAGNAEEGQPPGQLVQPQLYAAPTPALAAQGPALTAQAPLAQAVPPAPAQPVAAETPAVPATATLAGATAAAHAEGLAFGNSVACDQPALWLEAVLARKPRMPSDLEARLLQGSALPIDFLLHDEVRHALRRGFWDALERSRR